MVPNPTNCIENPLYACDDSRSTIHGRQLQVQTSTQLNLITVDIDRGIGGGRHSRPPDNSAQTSPAIKEGGSGLPSSRAADSHSRCRGGITSGCQASVSSLDTATQPDDMAKLTSAQEQYNNSLEPPSASSSFTMPFTAPRLPAIQVPSRKPAADGETISHPALQRRLKPSRLSVNRDALPSAASTSAGNRAVGSAPGAVAQPNVTCHLLQAECAAGNSNASPTSNHTEGGGHGRDESTPAGGSNHVSADHDAAPQPGGGQEIPGVSTSTVELLTPTSSRRHRRTISLQMGSSSCALDIKSGLPATPPGMCVPGTPNCGLPLPSVLSLSDFTSSVAWQRAWDFTCLLLLGWDIASGVALAAFLLKCRLSLPLLLQSACMVLPLFVTAFMLFVRNRWTSMCREYVRWILRTSGTTGTRRDFKRHFVFIIMEYFVLGTLGVIIATYLCVGYFVLALFGVLLLDFILLAVLVSPRRKSIIPSNLVYLENYKVARFSGQAVLQSLPQIGITAWMLAASSHPGTPASQLPR